MQQDERHGAMTLVSITWFDSSTSGISAATNEMKQFDDQASQIAQISWRDKKTLPTKTSSARDSPIRQAGRYPFIMPMREMCGSLNARHHHAHTASRYISLYEDYGELDSLLSTSTQQILPILFSLLWLRGQRVNRPQLTGQCQSESNKAYLKYIG